MAVGSRLPGEIVSDRGQTRIIVASPEASWFETREAALLTMRVQDLTLKERREAMRLEG
jgi:hypothetical protein